MPSDDAIEVIGVVVKVLPATMYKVKLENGHEVLAHISGKMRKFFIKIAAGDRVTLTFVCAFIKATATSRCTSPSPFSSACLVSICFS